MRLKRLLAVAAARCAILAVCGGFCFLSLVGCDGPADSNTAAERQTVASSTSTTAAGDDSAAASASHADSAAAAPASDVRRCNVVLFLIDTLRADRCGAYGYDKNTTPVLDQIAEAGVLFKRAQSPAPWTCPSIPSIMTGTFCCEHGVTTENNKLSPEIKTIAERFKQLDYHTASFWINTFGGPATGMDHGFDICRNSMVKGGKALRTIDGAVIDRWGRQERPADKPFFLYVHNIEPHNPFNAQRELVKEFGDVPRKDQIQIGRLISPYRNWLKLDWERGEPLRTFEEEAEPQLQKIVGALDQRLDEHLTLYDAVVREGDYRLGTVIQSLQKQGVWDDTLLIVLSDHGEEFAERGDYLHSQSLYQELNAVPLVVRFPNNEFAGTVVEPVVSLVDVLPTIFDYVGRSDLIGDVSGESLMPLIRGETPPDDALKVASVRINQKKWRPGWAYRGNRNVAVFTRDGKWKGIWNVETRSFEAYQLREDPGEKYNVCHEQQAFVERAYAYVKDWYGDCLVRAKVALQSDLSDEDLRILAALGYVGGEGAEDSNDNIRSEIEGSQPLPPSKVDPCLVAERDDGDDE